MEQQVIFGYMVEKAAGSVSQGVVAYKLIGPRATYTLVRSSAASPIMTVINSNGNITGIKGNYTFTDERGPVETRESVVFAAR